MTETPVSEIKKAQKERLLQREISQLFSQLILDDSRLAGMFISRVKLSADKSICFVFFYTPEGKSFFEEKLEILKLYKPSLRTAIAQQIAFRYTPDLVFRFDEHYEKEERINSLLDKLKSEGQL